MRNRYYFWCTLAMVMHPALAQAHVGVGEAAGLMHGVLHPFSGVDHLAVMIAVGLWAAQQRGKAIFALPIAFVSAMTVGSLLAGIGLSIPYFEPGIVASMLVLGLFLAIAVEVPLTASSFIVSLFGLFHGYAHGLEIPSTESGAAYCFGFVLSTCLVHIAGIVGGVYATRTAREGVIRYAGGAMTAMGFYLMIK